MTKNEAEKMNLIYTGISQSCWEDNGYCKTKAAEFRKEFGGKAYVVTDGDGYKSVMIDQQCWACLCAKDYQQRLENYIPAAKQRLLEEYQRKLAELEAEERRYMEYIVECNGKFPIKK